MPVTTNEERNAQKGTQTGSGTKVPSLTPASVLTTFFAILLAGIWLDVRRRLFGVDPVYGHNVPLFWRDFKTLIALSLAYLVLGLLACLVKKLLGLLFRKN
jgi:hypothetical protein